MQARAGRRAAVVTVVMAALAAGWCGQASAAPSVSTVVSFDGVPAPPLLDMDYAESLKVANGGDALDSLVLTYRASSRSGAARRTPARTRR